MIIKLFDKFKIEVHFIRLFYFTIFDTKIADQGVFEEDIFRYEIVMDACLLIFIILPLFVIMLRYLTSPIDLIYTSRLNTLLLPLCIIPLFLFSHYDILFLDILALLCNLLVTWKLLDPDDYKWTAKYRQNKEESQQSYVQ